METAVIWEPPNPLTKYTSLTGEEFPEYLATMHYEFMLDYPPLNPTTITILTASAGPFPLPPGPTKSRKMNPQALHFGIHGHDHQPHTAPHYGHSHYFNYLNPRHPIGEPSPFLNLSYWHLTDASIRGLLKINSAYKTLIVRDSPHFYDNRLRIFANRSNDLNHLCLANCRKLTPFGIKDFFGHTGGRLMSLDISENMAVDDDSLLAAMSNAKGTLKNLNVSKCR